MKRNINAFRESYYDHACTIDYEKDVLDIDIQENRFYWWSRIKRWWNDLFLLSYSDQRSRCYYRSSHCMRLERMKQFRYYKGSIHPFSKFRNFWKCLTLGIVLLSTMTFNHCTSILYGDLSWEFYFIGVICEAIIILDLCMSMLTGYIIKADRTVNLEISKSILKFCSTKLFLHFLSSVPLQSIMFFKYGKNISCPICKCNMFVFTLRLVSVLRLYRLYDASECWQRQRISIRAMYLFKFLRIAVLGLFTMLTVMKLADTISLIVVMQNGDVDNLSYYLSVIRFKYDERYPQPNVIFFTLELARVFKSFLLFSFGLRPKIHYSDKMSSLCSFIIANLFYMWNLIECHGCLSRIKYPKEQLIINKYRIINLLRWHQLSDDFTRKVLQYHKFKMSKLTVTEKQNACYHSLPASIKEEIILSSYYKHVSRISHFSEWPQHLIKKVVMLLNEDIYLENDIVIEASDSSDGLVIVDVGVLAIYSEGDVKYLIDGDYYSEICLVSDENIPFPNVISLTPSKILFLDKSVFRCIMREYPELFIAMKRQILKDGPIMMIN